jgi:hypothetical protein
MARTPAGHIERLPSGSWRVKVYAGTDPLTGREIRLRKTCKTERAAQIELGKLLEQAAAGRQPETGATVAQLMDRYVEIADWDLSTRKANEFYIRRVIKPALGHLQLRKVRGPLLDLLYAQLRRCGDHACTGKPFIEHRNVPVLAIDPPAVSLPGSRSRTRSEPQSAPGYSPQASYSLGPRDERLAGRPGGYSAARPGGSRRRGAHRRPPGSYCDRGW